ncbi:MAG: NTP transferase domain-containing protein [Ignisphaera sp.]
MTGTCIAIDLDRFCGISMDIVIMAGGRGSRLGGIKKYFLEICNRKLIDVSLDVALNLGVNGRVIVCTRSEDVPLLKSLKKVDVVACPGADYVTDLAYILGKASFPVLVLPADMPFLTVDVVKSFLVKASNSRADVVTLAVCKDSVCRESGISLFRRSEGSWENIYFEESKELRDIDTVEDLLWAESQCGSTEETEELE